MVLNKFNRWWLLGGECVELASCKLQEEEGGGGEFARDFMSCPCFLQFPIKTLDVEINSDRLCIP